MNIHLNEMIRQYSRITQFPYEYKDIFKIDKPMRWLLADQNDQFISFYKKNPEQLLLDMDITGCFPTICRFLFHDINPDFVDKIDKLDDKLKKNIFISNTLKGSEYLKVLNIISKMVIIGFIFDRQDSQETSLLEFEKDGCLIVTTDRNLENCEVSTPFQEFVIKAGFKFHVTHYDYYIRCNNTSWFWKDQDQSLKLKGIYKYVPPKIKEFYENLFSGKSADIDYLRKIYNDISLQFIRKNNLSDLFKDYFFCDDERIMNSTGKYEKYQWNASQINPKLYLYNFIFPIWTFYQRNLNNIQ